MVKTATANRKSLVGTIDEDEMDADRNQTNFYKPSEGRNRVFILPPSPEANELGRHKPHITVFTHFGVGLDGKSVPCPQKNGQETSCSICRFANKLKDEKERKALSAKARMRVVVFDVEHADRGLQIYEFGYKVKNALDSLWDEHGNYTDPEKGYNIIIERSGTGLQSQYNVTNGKSVAWPDSLWDKVEEGIPSLEETVQYLSEKDMQKLLEDDFGDEDEDEEEEEEYVAPAPRRRPTSARPASRPMADDNEDEEDDDEEEEDDFVDLESTDDLPFETVEAPKARGSLTRSSGGLRGARTMSSAGGRRLPK